MTRSVKSRNKWGMILKVIAGLVILLMCFVVVFVFFNLRLGLSGAAGMAKPTLVSLATATSPDPVIVPPTPSIQPQPTISPTGQSSLQEQRTLSIEWPPVIRAGDSDVIRLTLEVTDLGEIIPTAEIEGHSVTGETVIVPNLYDTHHVLAAARLDMAGMQVSPAEMTSQTLLPGERITFYWSIHPEEAGNYLGVVWFFLRFVPNDGGPETERAIAAQQIEIQVVSFLGLKAGPARILGVVGGFISSVFGMPFVEDSLKWIWKRLRRG